MNFLDDDPHDVLDFGNLSKKDNEDVLAHIRKQYWMRGRLRYKCFPGGQTQLYDRAHEQSKLHPNTAEPLVALCHRRFGKSHWGGIMSVERCLAQPGAEVHFGTDTKQHARNIIEGKLFETFRDMPKFISYRTRSNIYFFRNAHWPRGVESQLILEGLDYKDGGGMRGGSADLFIVDEAREIRQLEFVMNRVVTPMFKGRPNPMCILCSTPPDSMDHDFVRIYIKKARDSNSLITIPASQNPDWNEDDTKLMLRTFGSKEDIGWRREIECELIADTSRMIVPEWIPSVRQESLKDLRNHQRPNTYPAYAVLDMGWKDHSAAIIAYYDFHKDKIVILDELFVNYTPTEDFAEMLVDKLHKNFPGHIINEMRILADGNQLNLADLNRALSKLGHYHASEADKWDRQAGINNMRSGIQANKIIIDMSCEKLDNQLMNGLWNKRRTDFDRSHDLGHCDLLACLNYLYKGMRWGENVAPTAEMGWREGICHNPAIPASAGGQSVNEQAAVLQSVFGKSFLGRRRKW